MHADRIVALICCCFAALCSIPQRSGDGPLRARSLDIVDVEGRVRMHLGDNPRTGLSGVYLYGTEGQLVAEFGVDDPGEPFIVFRTLNGRQSMKLEMSSRGETSLKLLSPSTSPSGSPAVRAELGVGAPVESGPTRSASAGYLRILNRQGRAGPLDHSAFAKEE